VRQLFPETEPTLKLTVAQALPKGDKMEEIIRACTEIGVSEFVLFQAERSVVQWDEKKRNDRIRRYETIVREECEVSFRTILPKVRFVPNLATVLATFPDAVVMSETEDAGSSAKISSDSGCIVVGPEGGWAPRELALIKDRGVTLGPRVLRVEHAAAAAASLLLLHNPFLHNPVQAR
jgi:16S rRNA (uracil1498-N3)-methyltransferase